MQEEPQTSAISKEDKPERILEKKKETNSEVTMDQPQTPLESADPSASASQIEAGSENQLRMFVTLLTLRVMKNSHALQKRSQEEWVAHTKRLVNQTMEGLTITEDFCPDTKTNKKVSRAVLKDLQKKFGGKRLLESLLPLQDPAVDAAIVQSLQAHVTELSASLAEKAARNIWWEGLLQVLAFSGSILSGLIIMLLI